MGRRGRERKRKKELETVCLEVGGGERDGGRALHSDWLCETEKGRKD